MTNRLDPKDYYYVRFIKLIDPDTGVRLGDTGVVIEHYAPNNCIIEVAPWDINGEPAVIVSCPRDCVEWTDANSLDDSQRLTINQRWKDIERWAALRQKGNK